MGPERAAPPSLIVITPAAMANTKDPVSAWTYC